MRPCHQEKIEQLQREIEHLEKAIKETEDGFIINAYIDSIDDKKEEIQKLLDGEEEYPEGDNHIDMSGASDNGDR